MKRLLTFVVTALLIPGAVLAAPITSLVVVGDSLSDNGNAFVLTGGAFPPAPYAHHGSNGPVAVDQLAARLGVALTPSALGGTNYAVLGAATGPIAVPGTSIVTDNFTVVRYGQLALEGTGILNQAGAIALGGIADPAHTLFFVWGGSNDFFLDQSPASAVNAVNNLATAIGTLYAAGARRFLVPGMPDLSLTPSGLALPPLQRAALQGLSAGFNVGLETALTLLDPLPGIEITRFDTFALLTALSANPAGFGFSNATDSCLSGTLETGVSVCGDPSSYVFWDSTHPTTAAHAVLGNAFADAVLVPEPAVVALAGVGFALVGLRRARASRRG